MNCRNRRARLLVPFAFFIVTVCAAQQYDAETEALLERGRQSNSTGKFEDAIKAFKDANKRQQNACSACYRGLAAAYSSMGNLGEADKNATKAISTARDAKERANAHFRRGMVLMTFSAQDPKKLPPAEEEFRQALNDVPLDPQARLQLGIALLKQKKDTDGVKELAVVAAGPYGDLASTARSFIANPRRAREWFAPNFEATTLQGNAISLAELAGKVVVLDFWATWCPPCRESVPELKDLVKKFPPERFVLISISADEEQEKWKSFIADRKMDWPQVYDGDHQIADMFNVHAFPTYLVIDGEGVVRQRISGLNPQQSVASRIKETLKSFKELN